MKAEDHPDKIGINLKTIKTKFEKGDYIVDFRTNNCYKLGSGSLVYVGSSCFYSVYFVELGFSEKSKWRYANQKEIEKYDEQGTYYNIDILNKEEKWIPKVGEWVIFIPEVAKKLGYHTECWNKPYILKIDRLYNNSPYFSNEQMKKAGYINANAECSNSISCFRKALDHEIPKESNNISEKDKLLEIAKKNYPIGTIIDLIGMYDTITESNQRIIIENNHEWFGDIIQVRTQNETNTIYRKGKWVNIINESRNTSNSSIKIFEKYDILPYTIGIDPYQDTSTKEKCHMINISNTVPVITSIKDNNKISILKASKSKRLKIYSINN